MADVGDESEVQRLQKELLAFVTAKIEAAVVQDPLLPLSKAMVDAIDRRVGEAAKIESAKFTSLDPDRIAQTLVEAVKKELPSLVAGAKAKETARKLADQFDDDGDSGPPPPPIVVTQPPMGSDTPRKFSIYDVALLVVAGIVIGIIVGYLYHGWRDQPLQPAPPPDLVMNNSVDPFDNAVNAVTVVGEDQLADPQDSEATPTPTPSPAPVAENRPADTVRPANAPATRPQPPTRPANRSTPANPNGASGSAAAPSTAPAAVPGGPTP